MFKRTNFILFFLLVIILNFAFFSCQQPQLSPVDKTETKNEVANIKISGVTKSYGDFQEILATSPIPDGWVIAYSSVSNANLLCYWITDLRGAPYGVTERFLANNSRIPSGWVVLSTELYPDPVNSTPAIPALFLYAKNLNGASSYGTTVDILAELSIIPSGWVIISSYKGNDALGTESLFYKIKYIISPILIGTITATPQNIIVPQGGLGTITLNWDSSSLGSQVYVSNDIDPSEVLFSQTGYYCSSATAPWIVAGHYYDFNLYDWSTGVKGTKLSTIRVTGIPTSGSITASPQSVPAPQGGVGTSTLSWNSNASYVQIHVSCDGQQEVLFYGIIGNSASATAPWIVAGHYYDFNLYDWSTGVKGTKLSTIRVTGIPTSGSITASPQTVPAPQGGVGTSTLTWNSNASYVQIHVSCDGQQEVLFYGIIGNSASATAPWIQAGHYYDFNLYDWSTGVKGTKLATIRVTGVPVSGTISASPQTVSVPQGGLVSSTLTWNSNASAVQVYVSCNGGPEDLFGQTGSNGSATASWIQVGYYDFNLYDYSTGVKGTKLATIRVTGVS